MLNVDVDGRGVASVVLDRPERRNALDTGLIDALRHCADRLDDDPQVRVVVLSGAGGSFCAGGDLRWMRTQFDATRKERTESALTLARMLDRWNRLDVPVVARVDGDAYGGGVGLICVSDVAIADDRAHFGLTETRLGLVPATISPFVMARLGEGACRDLWIGAEIIDAERAVAVGLLRSAHATHELDAALDAVVAAMLARSPRAMRDAKRLARRLGAPIDDAVLISSAEQLADQWETSDAREGVLAFLERRSANWPSAARAGRNA